MIAPTHRTVPHALLAFCLLILVTMLCACAKPQQGPPLPKVKIGLAGFTQPRTPLAMLAGYAPEEAPEIPQKIMTQLDESLENVLARETNREYLTGNLYMRCKDAKPTGQTRSRGSALRQWAAVGMCMKVDVLLVPHILAYHEREGSEAGITKPASVTMDLFLIDAKSGTLFSRSHFEETQTALTDNLLNTPKFFSRGGKWITGMQLAREGMLKAIKDLGL